MAYLPDGLPLPDTSEIDTKEWWAACARREFVMQQCKKCSTYRYPPAPVCFHCRSFEFTWTRAEGKGYVYSYIITHHAVHAALKGRAPYNAAVIELPHLNVRMVGNIIDAKNEELYVGMPVKLTWEEREGVSLPQWLKDPHGVPRRIR